MQVITILFLLTQNYLQYNCDIEKAAEYFKDTELINDDFDDSFDPYTTIKDEDTIKRIEKVIQDDKKVCAMKYVDDQKKKYRL